MLFALKKLTVSHYDVNHDDIKLRGYVFFSSESECLIHIDMILSVNSTEQMFIEWYGNNSCGHMTMCAKENSVYRPVYAGFLIDFCGSSLGPAQSSSLLKSHYRPRP